MKEVYVIDIMNQISNNIMLYDVFGIWATEDGAKKELNRICDQVNNSELPIIRASINGNTCTVESCETDQWLLLSRLHIIKKPIKFD